MMIPITLTLDSQVKTVRVNSKLTKYKTVNNNGKMKIALPRPSTFRPNSSKSTNIVFSFFVWYIRVFCAKMRDTWSFFHQSTPLHLYAKSTFSCNDNSRQHHKNLQNFLNTLYALARNLSILLPILQKSNGKFYPDILQNRLKRNHRFDIIVPIIICR